MAEEGPQSDFMFLVTCSEAFGYTHEQTLDSSFPLILAMLGEHGYMVNERNRAFDKDKSGASGDEDEDYVYLTDYNTGKTRKVKKMKHS